MGCKNRKARRIVHTGVVYNNNYIEFLEYIFILFFFFQKLRNFAGKKTKKLDKENYVPKFPFLL